MLRALPRKSGRLNARQIESGFRRNYRTREQGANPKKQYKVQLKIILAKTENELLYKFIKGSAIQTIGDTLRKLVQPIGNPDLLKYLDESIRCAETNFIRASVVLAWCAVAFKVHQKLVSLTMPVLTAEFGKMKGDKGLMFRAF